MALTREVAALVESNSAKQLLARKARQRRRASSWAIIWIALLTLSTSAACIPFDSSDDVDSADEASIRELVNVYARALNTGDLDLLGTIVAPELVVVEGTHINRGWSDYRDHHLGPELAVFEDLSATISRLEINARGDVAWATYEYTMNYREPQRGRDARAEGRGTMVATRGRGDQWSVVHLHLGSH